MSSIPGTVYIVEDDPAVGDSLRAMIEADGHSVRCFASAEDYLDRIDDARPACLIADIFLPGMDAIALIQEAARRGMALPTILITGQPSPRICLAANGTAALAVLEKPFAVGTLLELIKQALHRGAIPSRT
jgi:two-component system response regulator FixJ